MELYKKNNTTFKRLSDFERGKIEALLRSGLSISEIARILNRAKSTICNEIKKGKYNAKYCSEISGNRAKKRAQNSHVHCKWKNPILLRFVERCLKKKWSPEIISHELKKYSNGELSFSHTSIYSLIKKHRPEWKKYLICQGKKYKKLNGIILSDSPTIKNAVSIEKRSKEVINRNRLGDFEVDTVVSSRDGKSCLSVIVCRATRYLFIRKIPNKSAHEMEKAIIDTLKDFDVKTITFDNGKENAFHEKITEALNCKCYFCHPYASYEKGSIENRNKLIRQFFRKGTNFDLITDEELSKIQDEINSRPMKLLNWLSPKDVFEHTSFH